MRWLALLMLVVSGQVPSPPMDVTSVAIGTPTRIAELDLGRLKGEFRRLSWSPDATEICIVTADGEKPSAKSRVYVVALNGSGVTVLEREPDWASSYWARKSDRSAPGLPSIEIGVERKTEVVKFGTGSAGALDRESSGLGADNVNSTGNIERVSGGQDRRQVVRLTLFGATIAEFVDSRPLPGLSFGWGPDRSAALAFTDGDGHLYLLDNLHHTRAIEGVTDALLPAWTTDGSRLAYLQKTGRRKYALMNVTLAAVLR